MEFVSRSGLEIHLVQIGLTKVRFASGGACSGKCLVCCCLEQNVERLLLSGSLVPGFVAYGEMW